MLHLLLALTAIALPATAPPVDSARFVVLGHIRGEADGLNPRLAGVLEAVRALHPDFVVLTGDIIWGDVNSPHADSLAVEREWDATDSALATLGVPVYRVPGNHDINDVTTRNIWWRRYGPLPAAAQVGSIRLLLLSSAWIPPDGDTRHHIYIGGKDLDSAQVGWLARELETPSPATHTFAFLHHLLWWEPDSGGWWKDVHPLLARGKVRALFSGDYGPLKFSTLERDSVRYYQSAIEGRAPLRILQNNPNARVLSAQFDNFFEVVTRGPEVRVIVHPVNEVASGMFTPAHYRAVQQGPGRPLWSRVWALIGSPRRLAVLGGGVLLIFGAGFLLGRRRAARRA